MHQACSTTNSSIVGGSTITMRGEGDDNTDTNTTHMASGLHKSCDRCGLKKRKCDGGNPCRRCKQMGDRCIYSKRRRANRPQTPGTVFVGSASGVRVLAPSPLPPGSGVSSALLQYGRVSLKRCRFSPSPATGLVGMQENMFLSDYFGCVGFLPLTNPSNIRETMVNMFAGPASVQHSDSGDYSTTEGHFDTVISADSELPVDPSTCVFWCAVAVGSLVKGRPIESVEKYSRLARDALAKVCGPPSAEVARAWAILAYMSAFCGDHDNFLAFLQRANDILYDVQEEGNETLPAGLADVVNQGETVKMFAGEANMEEVKSFCNRERAVPQMTEAATEGEICQFLMQSFRSLEQALYDNVFEHLSTTHINGGDDEPSTENPVGVEMLGESSPHVVASLMRESGDGSPSSRILDMMTMTLRTHSSRFQRLELAADRSSIQGGIGGLIINGTLVFEKLARKDMHGALEKLESCAEVLQRYPGLCRFTVGSHIAHMLLANLAAIDDPRVPGIYNKLRTAYNYALLPGSRPVPPFEEWQGVSSCCDNYNCRLRELMLTTEFDDDSSFPSPQERVAEVQKIGPNDAPVEDRQQTGGASATSSAGGAEETSGGVSQRRLKTIDAPRPNWEHEPVSDAEPAGWVQSMSSDGRQTGLTRPPELTLSASLVGKGAFEPVIDSAIGSVVDEQSDPNSGTVLGAQSAEAPFQSELSKSRTMMIDGIEDGSIGVEDWLDVTHAMLDSSGPGLDLE